MKCNFLLEWFANGADLRLIRGSLLLSEQNTLRQSMLLQKGDPSAPVSSVGFCADNTLGSSRKRRWETIKMPSFQQQSPLFLLTQQSMHHYCSIYKLCDHFWEGIHGTNPLMLNGVIYNEKSGGDKKWFPARFKKDQIWCYQCCARPTHWTTPKLPPQMIDWVPDR